MAMKDTPRVAADYASATRSGRRRSAYAVCKTATPQAQVPEGRPLGRNPNNC